MNKTEVFSRRLLAILAVKYGLNMLSVYAFAMGVIYLAGKLILRTSFSYHWTIWLCPLIMAVAVWMAWQKVPDAGKLTALLDKHGSCGGLLMAANDMPLGSWEGQIRDTALPRIRIKVKGSVVLLCSAMVFATICIMMPQKMIMPPAAQPVHVTSQLEDLKQDIDLLKDEGMIDQAKLLELNQKLDTAKQSADDTDAIKTWEALDSLKQEIGDLAQAGATKAIADIAQMSQAQDLADSLQNDSNSIEMNAMSQAMAQLSKDMQKLAAENKNLKADLGGDVENALNGSSLTPEQLKKLSEALSKCKNAKAGSIGKMCKSGMTNPDLLKICEKACQARSDALKSLREGCKGGSCQGQGSCNLPGQGGVTRGRGDAMLTFGDESSQQQAAFKEKPLEPAALGGLDQSTFIGESFAAPQLNEEDATGPGVSAAKGSTASGANKYKLLPRHRTAVKNYFERKANGN